MKSDNEAGTLPPVQHKIICKFATPEHKESGDQIDLKMIDTGGAEIIMDKAQKLRILALENDMPTQDADLSLSYGDILALAGDYFADKQPIATAPTPQEARQRFIAGFNNLAKSGQSLTDDIFKINQNKYSKSSSLNEYIQQALFVKLLGFKYFSNTASNLDHFYEWSIKAYNTGHEVALEMAQKGYQLREEGNYQLANDYLSLAYQLNAFACHFLSDTFSSGHLRERSLREDLSKQFGVLGGVLVNNMHNEDSNLGVIVTNKQGVQWTAYGDDNYDRPENKVNREIQFSALQQSANEIFAAYKTGKIENTSKLDQFLPRVVESSAQNAPMFKSINNKVCYRDPINELNPANVKYKELSYFSAFVIAAKLRLFPDRYKPTYTSTGGNLPSVNTRYLLNRTNCDFDEAQRLRKDSVLAPTGENQTVHSGITTPALTQNLDDKSYVSSPYQI